VQALDYLTSFNREKLLIPYRMPQDESPFRQGRTAMVLGSRGDVSRILTIHPDWKDNLGFAEVKGLKDSSFSGAQIYFIPESSRSKDEAWEYIKSLLEKETLWRMYQELGTIPVRKSLGEAFIKDQPQLHQVVLGALSHGDGNPKVTWAPLFVKYFDMAYEKAMYGDVSPGAALSEAEKLLLADMKK
jgi:ABC-type glycerol-3-phosphate transport system substrate-binding protein